MSTENNDLKKRLGEKIARQNNMYEKILEANGMKNAKNNDSEEDYASDNNAEMYAKYEG